MSSPSPSRIARTRRGTPKRSKIAPAATASGGETIAPSTKALAQPKPGASHSTMTATASVLAMTRPTASKVTGANVPAQEGPVGHPAAVEEQRRQDGVKDPFRGDVHVRQTRHEGNHRPADHEDDRIRQPEPLCQDRQRYDGGQRCENKNRRAHPPPDSGSRTEGPAGPALKREGSCGAAKLRISASAPDGRFMSKLIRTAAAVATAIVGITFTGCSSSGGSGGGNIATVNDQHITKANFDNRLESSPTAKQVLTQLVQQALIDQYAQDQKITIPQSDIDKKEADIKSKYPPGQFDAILKQQNLTETDVQNILRQPADHRKSRQPPMVNVTDADIAAYFAKNHTTLDKPPQVRARHILVADEKTADMIEGKLKAGGNFADLAKQYSTDPSTKDKGGELGFFGVGQMVKPFSDAAFSLPVGAVSAPVKSPFGWHIINVEEKKPATLATLAASSAQIKDTLTQQQEQQQIPVFLQGLRAKANIQVFDDRFKDAFPPPLPTPPPAAAPPASAPSAAAPAPAKS